MTVVDSVVEGGEEEEGEEVEEAEEVSRECRSEETDHDGFDRTSSIVGCVVSDEKRMILCRDRGRWTDRTLGYRYGEWCWLIIRFIASACAKS